MHGKKPLLFSIAGLLAAFPWSAPGEPSAKQPFSIDWAEEGDPLVDLSRFLEAPAGRDGFLRVDGEHLVRQDGTRFRVWGVNVTSSNCFPPKNEAPLIADDFARLGFNCIRFHHFDAPWGDNIFDEEKDDTRHLDREQLDRLDFFIAELAKRGIYTNLNLNVTRYSKAGDGVRDYQALGPGKGANYFNGRIQFLQMELARNLLTHRNPYTGHEYRSDPAVAFVEIVNENSLVESWMSGRLVGEDTEEWPGTWANLPTSYAKELTALYNAWLVEHVKPATLRAIREEVGANEVPRLAPDGFAEASQARFHTEARFLMDLEKRFFQRMKTFLTEVIGTRSIVLGDADHNDWISGHPHLQANLLFDLIDAHGYWEHPKLMKNIVSTKNGAMVNDPFDCTYVQFARAAVAGRPFTISETNHPFPHRKACEGFPILTAYALFSDWDGIYWFEYGPGRSEQPVGIRQVFGFGNDPVKLTNLYACGLMWHRQDIEKARETVLRSVAADEVVRSLRYDRGKERPFFVPGFARSTVLEHASRVTYDGSLSDHFPPGADKNAIRSDTGELGWFGAAEGKGVVVVDSPSTQALVGFVRDSGKTTSNLSATPDTAFCSIVLSSLDGEPVATASQLLLTATGEIANTGMEWEEDGQTIKSWGGYPTVIETVKGSLVLNGLEGATSVRLQALSPGGRAKGEPVALAKADDGSWSAPLGEVVTTWYILTIER